MTVLHISSPSEPASSPTPSKDLGSPNAPTSFHTAFSALSVDLSHHLDVHVKTIRKILHRLEK